MFKLTLHVPCDEALTRTQRPIRGIPDKNGADHKETIRHTHAGGHFTKRGASTLQKWQCQEIKKQVQESCRLKEAKNHNA